LEVKLPTHFEGTSEEELALNTYIKLTRATDTILTRLYPGGKLNGLTASQFGTLETLYHLGNMCQGEIGDKILKSSGNMTLVIDNLEKQGLVQRERDTNDRRQVNVSLTPKGKAIIEETFPVHLSEIVAQFSILSSKEQEALNYLLRKLGQQEKVDEA
jgi:MarR family 2-MHQ and catechol resistance regulon transcriptional repressor